MFSDLGGALTRGQNQGIDITLQVSNKQHSYAGFYIKTFGLGLTYETCMYCCYDYLKNYPNPISMHYYDV